MQKQIGPYHYFDGNLKEKTFGDRSFTILISSAYNAGIIGPENNGIVVLDDNNRSVLLDRHVEASTGYFGPTPEQKAEFERIMAMDWREFSEFVASNPRYRGTAEDINNREEPDSGDKIDLWIAKGKVPAPSGPDIRTPEMISAHDSAESDFAFPDKTREEMIVALANHKGYHPMNYNNGGFVVSWDIKVHGQATGKHEGFEHDPAFDERWEKYLEDNEDVFWDACSDALYHLTSGEFEPVGSSGGRARFYTNGRSGGHLVLKEWSGSSRRGWASCQMAFDDRHDYIEWLKELGNSDLVKFYSLVQSVDAMTRNPTNSVNFSLAAIREMKEEEWVQEARHEASAPTM